MEGCKANKCKKTVGLIYNGNLVEGWNDFERCSKKVYKDGFCKRCYEPDKRYKSPAFIPDQLWKRDGIYGEPYDFPYHKKESEKEWVKMMYTLHPHLRTKEEDKIKNALIWLEKNSDKISYKLGLELHEILSK